MVNGDSFYKFAFLLALDQQVQVNNCHILEFKRKLEVRISSFRLHFLQRLNLPVVSKDVPEIKYKTLSPYKEL